MNKLLAIILVLFCSCEYQALNSSYLAKQSNSNLKLPVPVPLQANKFNYPVGPPDGKGYYNAQGFGKNFHLGDDWNSTKGGNNDLGDPVHTIANGYVNSAEDLGGGWGNVIRITHYLPDGTQVESLYAHCDTMMVKPNSWVEIGDQIGTIGTAHGQYIAHLHFEIRDQLNMGIGGGYSRNTNGYIDPSKFIKSHREIK